MVEKNQATSQVVYKQDLIKNIVKKTNGTIANVTSVVKAVFDEIKESTIAGKSVAIHRFGVFVPRQRAPRTIINPTTKKKMNLPKSKSIGLKVSGVFKGELNN